ncbi:hypothetical protein JNUCC0626_16710 [Lentzea sp. JNUCC 0626]|uniref:hypothetical protein n=1 Tax=Lentzea sp. JNUCC 0626 TaxID=3367513 RepID=UPI003748B6E2
MSRRFVCALLVTGLISACGSAPTPPPESPAPTTTTTTAAKTEIVLEVTGTATITTLTLTVDGTATEEKNVALPWNKTLEFPQKSGKHEWKLEMSYDGGTVHAKGVSAGRLLTQTSGSGSPGSTNSARLSGSISD